MQAPSRWTSRPSSAQYKAEYKAQADASPGQSGAILRREALYSSHFGNWRKAARAATGKALDKKRRRKSKSEAERENEKLRRDKARARALQGAVIIDGQKNWPKYWRDVADARGAGSACRGRERMIAVGIVLSAAHVAAATSHRVAAVV